MAEITNDRYLRALKGEPLDRTPVWIMRQAGRYLPEYRDTREQAGSFMDLCRNPELAAEVTLQPLRRYPLDASIVFSDILTIPDAMGLGLSVLEGQGPVFERTVRSAAEVEALGPAPMDSLEYVFDAIRTLKASAELTVPLIGFAGSPWTLATYMVEGQGSREFKQIKSLAYGDPDTATRLTDLLAESVTEYLKGQIAAGCDAVMVFDTWGGILPKHHYERFSLAPMQRIVDEIKAEHPGIPITLFTKGGGQWLDLTAGTGCDCVGLDWTADPVAARAAAGPDVTLQGNLDPAVLVTDPDTIAIEARRVLAGFAGSDRHVFNLGHGITPDVPPEHLARLIEVVHSETARG